MRIWQHQFWGVLALLLGITTSQSTDLYLTSPDDRLNATNDPTLRDHTPDTNPTTTLTPSMDDDNTQLDVPQQLNPSDKLASENRKTETSESQPYYDQLNNNKNITNNNTKDHIHRGSLSNNNDSNAPYLEMLFALDNDSAHLTDDDINTRQTITDSDGNYPYSESEEITAQREESLLENYPSSKLDFYFDSTRNYSKITDISQAPSKQTAESIGNNYLLLKKNLTNDYLLLSPLATDFTGLPTSNYSVDIANVTKIDKNKTKHDSYLLPNQTVSKRLNSTLLDKILSLNHSAISFGQNEQLDLSKKKEKLITNTTKLVYGNSDNTSSKASVLSNYLINLLQNNDESKITTDLINSNSNFVKVSEFSIYPANGDKYFSSNANDSYKLNSTFSDGTSSKASNISLENTFKIDTISGISISKAPIKSITKETIFNNTSSKIPSLQIEIKPELSPIKYNETITKDHHKSTDKGSNISSKTSLHSVALINLVNTNTTLGDIQFFNDSSSEINILDKQNNTSSKASIHRIPQTSSLNIQLVNDDFIETTTRENDLKMNDKLKNISETNPLETRSVSDDIQFYNNFNETENNLGLEHRLSADSIFLGGESGNDRGGFYAPDAREVEEAADYGLRMMNELVRVKEPQLYRMGLWLQRDDPAGKVAAFNAPNLKVEKLARYGYASLMASKKLIEQFLLSPSSIRVESRATPIKLSPELRDTLRGTALHAECPLLNAPIQCRSAARRYRTADGTCNHLEKPRLGSSLTPHQRFLPPQYDDGLQSIRRSVISRAPLPSPRTISTRIHRPLSLESPSITLMLMQWGQFIDHDVTSTPQSRAFNGTTPRCCTDGGRGFQSHEFMHPECLPIEISADDVFFARFGIRCMEFVRSAPSPREDCDFGFRQQINQVTSYIDASPIYGSSAQQSDSIRLLRSGLIHFGQPDPPNGGEPCRGGAVSASCMRPGDGRVGEQPALTALHIMWVRWHNSIAGELARINRQWSDEKVFQETRRIIGAVVQHVSYREFLPIVLGHEVTKLFDLQLITKGYYTGYNPRLNPSLSNAFVAAAYRFGHSLVQNSFVRSDRFHRPIFNNVSIHDEQANVENIWSPGSVDRLLLGLSNQPSQKRDEFISEELTNHLFQSPGFPFGLDLAAINVQRGRDQGVPSYTSWRQPCGLSPIKNWTDLQRVMSLETAERFRSTYLHVDDIDLFSAGLAERPVRGGLVGPTFACIIAQQFSNLRKGDRFWYENGNFESSFTPNQLQQIRKITLAQILCETMNEIDTIQPFVFLTPDNFKNQRKSCTKLTDFDLTPWTEGLNDFDIKPNRPLTDNNIESKTEPTSTDTNNSDTFTLKFKRSIPNLKPTIQVHNLPDNSHNFNRMLRRSRRDNDKQNNLKAIDSSNLKLNKLAEHTDDTGLKEFDELNLQMDFTTFDNIDSLFDETKQVPNPDTDLTDDGERNERKRKGQQTTTRRKKPKPSRNKNTTAPFVTTTVKVITSTTPRPKKKKTKRPQNIKQVSYYDTVNKTPDLLNYRPQNSYYARPGTSNPTEDEIVIIPSKRPNDMTYLFNSVSKTTTTPKPDYQFHIHINYFYNSTTERPTTAASTYKKHSNYDYSRPSDYNYNVRPSSFDYKKPNYNDYRFPSTYQGFDDKIDYGHTRYSTKRPNTVTSRPIQIIDANPNIKRPQTGNIPNIYIVNDFNQPKPTVDLQFRPEYEQRPEIYDRPGSETLHYKRPMTGHVTKLDSKPIFVYGKPGNILNNFYGTEVTYDNLDHNRPPPYYKRPNPYIDIDDKLDFNDRNKHMVKVSSVKKNMFTTPRPYYDDKRFVRISTVHGHTTQTDSLNPVFVSLQNKESEDDDLEMTYDDILEVYVKPDNDFVHMGTTPSNTRTDKNASSETVTETIPLPKQNDNQLCSTELPKPMNIFIEDDLLL